MQIKIISIRILFSTKLLLKTWRQELAMRLGKDKIPVPVNKESINKRKRSSKVSNQEKTLINR